METVYRVQDTDGIGAYRGRKEMPHAQVNTWDDPIDPSRHPLPQEDGLRRPDDDHLWRFGFASLPALCRWFNKADRAKLRRLGLKVARYLVPERWVRHGSRQVIFKLTEAKLQEMTDPTEV